MEAVTLTEALPDLLRFHRRACHHQVQIADVDLLKLRDSLLAGFCVAPVQHQAHTKLIMVLFAQAAEIKPAAMTHVVTKAQLCQLG